MILIQTVSYEIHDKFILSHESMGKQSVGCIVNEHIAKAMTAYELANKEGRLHTVETLQSIKIEFDDADKNALLNEHTDINNH
jgi:molybdopterin-guanine dinucleotide biosynthesis protein A